MRVRACAAVAQGEAVLAVPCKAGSAAVSLTAAPGLLAPVAALLARTGLKVTRAMTARRACSTISWEQCPCMQLHACN